MASETLGKYKVKVVKDDVGKVIAAINRLISMDVLVGIPDKNNQRHDAKTGPMNNSQIGYIMEFGSPMMNIPARAWLVPGVRDVQAAAVDQLRLAVQATLDGNSEEAKRRLNAAGIVGMNGAKAKINSNIPPPLSPYTIANRHRQRQTKGMREEEIGYGKMVAAGITPAAAQSEAGIVALINTGQLRNSVTWVVRKHGT